MLLRSAALALLLCTTQARAVTVKWSHARHATLPAEVSRNLMFAHLTVRGARLRFLIDTGATESVLDADTVARLGIKPGYLRGLDVVAPGVTVVALPFAVRSLAQMEVHLGRRIDGILAYDFLEWFAADFDFAAQQLRLTEALPQSSAGRSCLPLTFIARLPYVSVTVIGLHGAERSGTFLVDSGASGTLRLEGLYATDPALFSGPALRRGADAVAGVAAVRLGTFELTAPDIVRRESLRPDHADGFLGAAILGRFTVRFIYATHRMCLTPNAHAGEAFASDLAGFVPVWPEPDFKPLTVESVSPGSPAARAGLQPADVIESLGGHSAGALTVDELARLMRQPGAHYELQIRRHGNQLSLPLELPEAQARQVRQP